MNPREHIGEALLGTVVVGSALAIGTVHIHVLLAISALALIGATLEVPALRRVPRPALILVALGLFSALQAIPFPAAWVTLASPATAAVWERSLSPFGEPGPRYFSLSVDPSASVAEALKWLTYACTYVMATRMRARRGSSWLALLLFGSGALVAFITLLHGVADLRVVYGLYHPNFAVGRWSVGPLLNSNNLGGYAILSLFSGVGLWLSDRSPVPRLPITLGLGVISAALCLSGSRAAVLSVLMMGAVAATWLALTSRRSARFSPIALTLGIAPFVAGILIAVAFGTARDATQFTSLDIKRKASVWLWSLPMIRDHALFGVGRGAFETSLPPYRQALDYDWSIVVTHAENFIVQWVAEWGIPVGLGAVVVIVTYVLREWGRSSGDPQRFLVMTGLVALFVQNLADLGLEVPSLAIAAVFALAAGERPSVVPSGESGEPFGRRAFVVALPAFALCAAAIAWSRFPVELERSEMASVYRELDVKSSAERERFRTRLHQAMLRHPGEPFFPLLGSLSAMQASDEDALRWVARSLELGPTNGPVHLVLSELLHRHGATAQAMLHLRLATQYDRTLIGPAGNRAAAWAPTIDLLMQAIAEGPFGEGMLLDACTKITRLPMKLDCFRRASKRDPNSALAAEQVAESLLSAIQAGQPPCESTLSEACAAEAEQAIGSAEKLDPKTWRARYLRSKLLVTRGDFLAAAQLLTRLCPPTAVDDACWNEALSAALRSRSASAIISATNGFAGRGCTGSEACANMFSALATRLESGDQPALANTFYSRAAETDPSAARWLKVADHACRNRLYGVARSALIRADRSPDSSVATRADAELIRQKIAAATNAALEH